EIRLLCSDQSLFLILTHRSSVVILINHHLVVELSQLNLKKFQFLKKSDCYVQIGVALAPTGQLVTIKKNIEFYKRIIVSCVGQAVYVMEVVGRAIKILQFQKLKLFEKIIVYHRRFLEKYLRLNPMLKL
uniref:Uncharacterized protein n=1 Tax=Strigamia maritima TaxID=126957 RepID=T1JDK7_STRMM